jgi:arabinoxylan arabinofuranohydrolase
MKYKAILFVYILLLNSFHSIIGGGESDFNGINIARGFKDIRNHNPCLTQKFTADPGLFEYNGRVYVYGTNDGYLQDHNPEKNTYGQINTINVMSSEDLVNWSDHGTINVAGPNGIAKWAGNSWAPTAAHKVINGKEKFFLYFANNANGIGVLTSDTPTGPWTDPIGGPLISRQTPNCNVEWLFDPAVLVDSDGTGYLYFGGGVPAGKQANPNTIRAVKLGDNMISLAGNAVNIDAPWVF